MSTKYKDRTDSLQEKLRLLQAAYAAGQYDLAMSLSDSMKDTLTLERQLAGDLTQPQINAGEFTPIGELPGAWAEWARGWSAR